jgi:hypothetical protein
MGIVSFVMLTVTLVTGGVMLTAPLTYTFIPIRIESVEVLTFDQAVLCCSIGAIIVLLGMHMMNIWAAMWRKVASALLG